MFFPMSVGAGAGAGVEGAAGGVIVVVVDVVVDGLDVSFAAVEPVDPVAPPAPAVCDCEGAGVPEPVVSVLTE
jgi:hypothetical protein